MSKQGEIMKNNLTLLLSALDEFASKKHKIDKEIQEEE